MIFGNLFGRPCDLTAPPTFRYKGVLALLLEDLKAVVSLVFDLYLHSSSIFFLCCVVISVSIEKLKVRMGFNVSVHPF